MAQGEPKTLFEKIWEGHVVAQEAGSPAVLYVDLHLVHEVTSPQAFSGLRARGLRVRRPDKTLATVDHSIPTHDRSLPIADPLAARQVRQMEENCREFGVPLYDGRNPDQGIVHVIGPEQGLTQPGMTIVCGDPRGVRRAGVRHRDQRGRACAGDAVPAAGPAQDV
jgi:3-isopropylmalate/(R)-2-methylmalate dehydratase large subunit